MTTWINDFQNNVVGGVSIAPGTQGADSATNGEAVDLIDGDGPVHGVLLVGAINLFAELDIEVKLQESDDGSSGWADIDGSNVKTVVMSSDSQGALEDEEVRITAKNRSKRYVRMVATADSGSTGGTIEMASYVFSQARRVS